MATPAWTSTRSPGATGSTRLTSTVSGRPRPATSAMPPAADGLDLGHPPLVGAGDADLVGARPARRRGGRGARRPRGSAPTAGGRGAPVAGAGGEPGIGSVHPDDVLGPAGGRGGPAPSQIRVRPQASARAQQVDGHRIVGRLTARSTSPGRASRRRVGRQSAPSTSRPAGPACRR